MSIVVIGEEARRATVAGPLRDEGLEVVEADALPPLEGVDVVVFLNEPGGPLPDGAFEVLAARALLVVRGSTPTRGLEPGIDHLLAADDGAPIVYAIAAHLYPRAFDPIRAMGALKARLAS